VLRTEVCLRSNPTCANLAGRVSARVGSPDRIDTGNNAATEHPAATSGVPYCEAEECDSLSRVHARRALPVSSDEIPRVRISAKTLGVRDNSYQHFTELDEKALFSGSIRCRRTREGGECG